MNGNIKRIAEGDWRDDSVLWRYMDIYGFLSLITSKRLKFASLSEFEDGLEGRMPNQNRVTLSLDFLNDQYFTRSAEEVRELSDRLERMRNSTWVSSWQLSANECSLMWRTYGSRQNGVAITTTTRKLMDSLHPEYGYTAGPVRYINYLNDHIDDESDLSFSFHKQSGYQSEQEFRVVISEAAGDELACPKLIGVDVEKLIIQVVISPWAEEWQLEALKQVMEIAGYDEGLVKRSRITRVGN